MDESVSKYLSVGGVFHEKGCGLGQFLLEVNRIIRCVTVRGTWWEHLGHICSKPEQSAAPNDTHMMSQVIQFSFIDSVCE